MIRALVVGKIYGTPQVRTSATGNTFTTAKLKATGKDNETVWCSLIGFGEIGERLAILDEGASLSVAGRAEDPDARTPAPGGAGGGRAVGQ